MHCARFAEEGADVIALDGMTAAEDLDQTVALIEQRGRRGLRAFADVRDGASMLAAIDAAVGQFGRLDVIIANAGIHPPPAPAWELTEEAWRNTLDVNLTGVWHTITPGVAHMGHVGRLGGDHQFDQWVARTANTAHYPRASTRWLGLARTLANELGPRRIRVNTSIPARWPPRWC